MREGAWNLAENLIVALYPGHALRSGHHGRAAGARLGPVRSGLGGRIQVKANPVGVVLPLPRPKTPNWRWHIAIRIFFVCIDPW